MGGTEFSAILAKRPLASDTENVGDYREQPVGDDDPDDRGDDCGGRGGAHGGGVAAALNAAQTAGDWDDYSEENGLADAERKTRGTQPGHRLIPVLRRGDIKHAD